MIPITIQPELPNFDTDVRIPGMIFLNSCPSPRKRDWTGHKYWRVVNREFYQSYKGICAYTGCWFSNAPPEASVDHFRPKSRYPHLAYEWNNYRLTTNKTNRYKDDDDVIADPFTIKHGWFILCLPSCLIKPSISGISQSERTLIQHTIDQLKLNDDDDYVDGRKNIIQSYMDRDLDLDFLKRKYPFIAYELERQDFLSIEKLKSIFKEKA